MLFFATQKFISSPCEISTLVKPISQGEFLISYFLFPISCVLRLISNFKPPCHLMW